MKTKQLVFNWRRTMGNATTLPQQVSDYLDCLADILQEDGHFERYTKTLHTCGEDGPIVLLHHARLYNMALVTADYRQHDLALKSVRQCKGDKFPGKCPGCLDVDAYERMEKAIFALLAAPDLERFSKPGYGSPISGQLCGWGSSLACSTPADPCDHLYMKVKRMMREAHHWTGSSHEIRLNNAGLKLYITPVHTVVMGVRTLHYGLRVGGDQSKDYPGFAEYAHQLFAEHGVPNPAERNY